MNRPPTPPPPSFPALVQQFFTEYLVAQRAVSPRTVACYRDALSLSTYIGHAMVTNTYWYLSAVPELMALAAGRFEAYMSQAEVGDE